MRVIKTEEEYQAAMARINGLVQSVPALTVEERDELDLLAVLTEDYERRNDSSEPGMPMTLRDYEHFVRSGTNNNLKILLQEEELFGLTEAKAILRLVAHPTDTPDMIAAIQERLVCMMICHRSLTLCNWMMERAANPDARITSVGHGPVVPGRSPG